MKITCRISPFGMLFLPLLLCPAVPSAGPVPLDPMNSLAHGADWPHWRGATLGNSAVKRNLPLVDNIMKARLVWTSDDPLPWGKYCDSGDWGCSAIQGGYSSPIVADGKVYLFYFLPSGEIYDTRGSGRNKDLIEADDIIHCWDAKTGKTLWKKVFPRAGLNWGTPGKTGPQLTPTVRDGKVYALGTLGDVYCLNAENGELIWKGDIGLRKLVNSGLKAKAIQKGVRFDFNRDFLTSPMVIGGAVVNNTHGMMKGDNVAWGVPADKPTGLIAHDAITGQVLWVRDGIAGTNLTPLPWKHGDQEYVITATDGYLENTTGLKVLCLNPMTGKTLWEISTGSSGNAISPLVDGDNLICSVDGGMACFTLSPEKATRKWKVSSQYGELRHAAIDDHRIFFFPGTGIGSIDIATGKVTHTPGVSMRQAYGWAIAAENRLFALVDTDDFRMYGISGSKIVDMGRGLGNSRFTKGYDVPIMPAIVDGRIFVRTQNHGIACYDLRIGDALSSPMGSSLGMANTTESGWIHHGKLLLPFEARSPNRYDGIGRIHAIKGEL